MFSLVVDREIKRIHKGSWESHRRRCNVEKAVEAAQFSELMTEKESNAFHAKRQEALERVVTAVRSKDMMRVREEMIALDRLEKEGRG